jgi:RNA polymerase sigma-70 factor (ECF subfamily)
VGDEQSERQTRFRLLYDAHVEAVLAYAIARTDRQHALEATEATFLVAWRRFGELPEHPRPWLFGVARRVLADQRKAAARYHALEDKLARHAGTYDEADIADNVTERHEVLEQLRRLGERDREVLLLVAWEGLSLSEVAAAMGCSVTAATVRLHRARRRLAGLETRGGSAMPSAATPDGTVSLTAAVGEEGSA